MLYRFTSQATADLIMLKQDAEKVLEVWGKPLAQPGIVTPEALSAAIDALLNEAQLQEQAHHDAVERAKAEDEAPPPPPPVSFRVRIEPLVRALKHCLREEVPLTWKV